MVDVEYLPFVRCMLCDLAFEGKCGVKVSWFAEDIEDWREQSEAAAQESE